MVAGYDAGKIALREITLTTIREILGGPIGDEYCHPVDPYESTMCPVLNRQHVSEAEMSSISR